MKTIGHPVTDAERDLEAALAQVEPWRDLTLRYARVTGGLSNVNWRVWVEGSDRSFFVKIPGKGTELFINRRAAHEASCKAAALGVGPAVHDFLSPAGIEICDFVTDRRTCTHADFQDEALCRAVVDSYRRFHSASPLELTKTIFDMIDEHRQQVRELKGWLPPDYAAIDERYAKACRALTASGLDLVASFNDPMAGNFLVGEASDIMLIDYEYASNNDRCYDLGIWFGEMFFNSGQEAALIEHYFGRVDPGTVARVTVYRALADLKWGLWSMVQQRLSTLDFDYFKYGVWKFMRLRSLMFDPRWEGWLQQI